MNTPLPDWIHDPLLQTIAERAAAWLGRHALQLEDLCLGQPVSWAIVRDAEGRRALGTALTPSGEGGDRTELFQGLAPDWRDWPLSELPARLLARHPLDRCIALAVINAISQYRLHLEDLATVVCGDGLGAGRVGLLRWIIEQRPHRLVMIGNMRPLVEGLLSAGITPMVFERDPIHRSGAWSDALEWAWLPHADGLVATGATLLNHTLAPLIERSGAARFRLLVGFSAQVHPTFLSGLGLTHVFSVHIRDVERIRRRLQIGDWNAMFESESPYFASLAAA